MPNLNLLGNCLFDIDPATIGVIAGAAMQSVTGLNATPANPQPGATGSGVAVAANNDPIAFLADQSGNGIHAYIDTPAKRPLLDTTTFNGLPSISVSGGKGFRLCNPAALRNASKQALTIAAVLTVTNGTAFRPLLYNGGFGDSRLNMGFFFNNFQIYSPGGGIDDHGANSDSPGVNVQTGVPATLVWRFTPYDTNEDFGLEEIYINGSRVFSQVWVSRPAPDPTKELKAFADLQFADKHLDGYIARLIAWVGDVDIDAVHAGLAKYGTLTTPPRGLRRERINANIPRESLVNHLVAGDSITHKAYPPGRTWFNQLEADTLNKRAPWLAVSRWHNRAKFGQNVSAIAAAFATREAKSIVKGAVNVVYVFAGTNDLFGGDTAQFAFGSVSATCAAARAAGDDILVVVGCLPRGDSTDIAARDKWAAYNTLLDAHFAGAAPKMADGYINIRANKYTGTTNDIGTWGRQDTAVLYTGDKTHLQAVGQSIIADLVYDVVDPLIRAATALSVNAVAAIATATAAATAAAILTTPANKLATGVGGTVTASNSGGGGTVIRNVLRIGDFPQTSPLSPYLLTQGDTVELELPLRGDDGDTIILPDATAVSFRIRPVVIAPVLASPTPPAVPPTDLIGTLTTPDASGVRYARVLYNAATAGEFEAAFIVAGVSYPLGRRIPVRVKAAL